MSQLSERIAQFRKMATDDPDNELGHFRLGQLLAEAGQHDDAIASYERTLELSPQFSKVYQLLAESLLKLDRRDEAVRVLREGWEVADERGDNMPRDAMARLLRELGETPPESQRTNTESSPSPSGFRCHRPGCAYGHRAQPLPRAPIPGPIGDRILREICAGCWELWFRGQSIKVINELRLDLSSEFGAAEYDRYMREFLGFEDEPIAS